MSVGVLRVNYFALVPASMIEPIAFSLKTTVSGPFASKHTDIELLRLCDANFLWGLKPPHVLFTYSMELPLA